ncbi:MAG: hypothetical protein EOO65_05095, partial [Methanosarcinales archaeon]
MRNAPFGIPGASQKEREISAASGDTTESMSTLAGSVAGGSGHNFAAAGLPHSREFSLPPHPAFQEALTKFNQLGFAGNAPAHVGEHPALFPPSLTSGRNEAAGAGAAVDNGAIANALPQNVSASGSNPGQMEVDGMDMYTQAIPPDSAPAPDAGRTGSETAAAVTGALPSPKAVLFKVGNGHYVRLAIPWVDLECMDVGEVLTALQASVIFGKKMEGVMLDDCTVTIVPSITAGGRVPTATDEKDAVLVDG